MTTQKYSDAELLKALEKCEDKHGKATTKLINSDKSLPSSSAISNRFGTFSKAKQKADLEDIGQIHLTDKKIEEINKSISDRQKQILKGLLMGDAWICKEQNKTAYLALEITNKKFVEWLEEKLGEIVSDVRMRKTSKQSANKNRKYNYSVNEENYSNIWVLETRNLKYFDKLRQWYSSGKKRFPKSLDLTPTVLKMWYCCDGTLHREKVAKIYSSNESDRKTEVIDLFEDLNLSPNFTEGGGGVINFKVRGSEKFFEYIGEAPPGFEYKWP